MDNTSKRIIITGATVLVGFTLNQIARNSWFKIYDEEPPSTHPSEEINWKKVVLWSIVTGTAISSAKLATERYLMLKLKLKN
ncbi:MAG: DUF4235 domain-containing protein [Balneolaceae bacterium]|nr:MAG: DUF4235 domain-containing protein [Balneolaceae bacterium]